MTVEPTVTPDRSQVTVDDAVDVCISGFDAGSDVVVLATRPDGSTRALVPEGPDRWSLAVGASDPVGSYAISATQGTKSAAASVSVSPSTETKVESLPPDHGPPGTTFQFAVLAPSAHQTVILDLYANAGSSTDYATTLDPLSTDAQGRAVLQLPTATDDPPGSYCVIPRSVPSRCARFRVE